MRDPSTFRWQLMTSAILTLMAMSDLRADEKTEPADPVEVAQADPQPSRAPGSPPPGATTRAQPPRPAENSDSRQRLTRQRLTRSPEMFGDQFISQTMTLNGPPTGTGSQEFSTITSPAMANAFSQKISENNHPLPRDRVFYTFNSFDDALKFQSSTDAFFNSTSNTRSLIRNTVGVEKTFFDGQSSIEVRMPFNSNNAYGREVNGTDNFAYDGGTIGNMLLTGKVLVYESPEFIMSTGLGLIAPTGANQKTRVNGSVLEYHNNAVYLSPFVGALWLPSDEWFLMGFSQVQVSANGDPVTLRDPASSFSLGLGTVNAPSVWNVDLSLGRWLFRDRVGALVTGMALITEVHQFTALQGTDGFSSSAANIAWATMPGGDHLNLTTMSFGIHNQLIGNSTLRIAGVVPISSAQFNGELIVQFNVFF